MHDAGPFFNMRVDYFPEREPMTNAIVILAGYPATGKSTFTKALLKRHPEFILMTPDMIKERMWEDIGFDNAQQKDELERSVWVEYYNEIERIMRQGQRIVTDYPFSEKQYANLKSLVKKFEYGSVTIRFIGDLHVIYERLRQRDALRHRHLAHIVSHYRKGTTLENPSEADQFVDFELLKWRVTSKHYGEFCLGDLIEIDATDIASINPNDIVDKLDEKLKNLQPMGTNCVATEADKVYWDSAPALTEEERKVLALCDHTVLNQRATWNDVKTVLDDAIHFGCASACIPPYFVYQGHKYVEGRLKITTVVGFPNGNVDTITKVNEARHAIDDGADEIDMVVNLGLVASGDFDSVLDEIRGVRSVVSGGRILKVIIETCLLSDWEKVQLCELVTQAKADFIKTSTGFSMDGATVTDVGLLHTHAGERVAVKASGGIHSIEEAQALIEAGATRLGASSLVEVIKMRLEN
ncbi:deoxyribose-phosphate aldolase [Atopobium sp. oral taxon 810 str. F0209]|nr:deoxyribose-phosphate aldolase [Atopobium sp. oral taxon 810 str. F0209]